MIGLVFNKMEFKINEGTKDERVLRGVNLTLKGKNGFYVSKTPDKKIKFYSLPADIYKSVDVGKVYDFSYSVNTENGVTFIEDAEESSF